MVFSPHFDVLAIGVWFSFGPTSFEFPLPPLLYKGQSKEHRIPAIKWQWNLFYSKVFARSVNTFIPLGDETIDSNLVERGRSLMDPQPLPLLQFLVQMKPTSTNVFLQVVKNVEVTRGNIWDVRRMLKCFSAKSMKHIPTRLAVCERALSCKRMIPSGNIPRCFDCMGIAALSHQETTTVEQVVVCALATQRARVRFPVETSFLDEVFSGFFLLCKTNVRKL